MGVSGLPAICQALAGLSYWLHSPDERQERETIHPTTWLLHANIFLGTGAFLYVRYSFIVIYNKFCD
jgi:hypothetical protein